MDAYFHQNHPYLHVSLPAAVIWLHTFITAPFYEHMHVPVRAGGLGTIELYVLDRVWLHAKLSARWEGGVNVSRSGRKLVVVTYTRLNAQRV
jgi:hypothetical protein